MNTPKYNIEHEIKNQIEEREITPSRDLWSEIESQTSAPTSVKTRINWFLVAACLGLLLSLGIVLVNSSDEEVAQPQIVETTIQPTLAQPENKIGKESTPLLVERTEPTLNKINPVISTQETKIIDPEVIVVQKQIPAIKQKEIIPAIAPDQFSNSIAIIDSAKVPVKRKRFVDPSTLLFSVEHKDVIEKSKDGSNVATIDLNSK
ncbi:hypothetical protein [Kaistella antarctica]|uniref:Uncharacterized protein n=1 Tax=Kaistella antarctica TaxID=266748 RepID=A0A448NTD1_9FLAO|nr:hypothetical protein [Kaistella antarctica]KEY18143.1 hypothetical protein HY04_06375 [Kaistella antarctica]SEV83069.1 hypothetical protein SAMN05421765_0481 [Kaistella antarctica]VEI00735.1 Uncharacterised protein [Kaistella antarctica]